MAALAVRPVTGRSELRAFLDLPRQVYGGDPHWSPPLDQAAVELTRPGHPFHAHGRSRLFLAWRDGDPVGRVAGLIDAAYQAHHGPGTAFFGFFEARPDPEAAQALLQAVRDWAKAEGQARLLGPFNPTPADACGLLAEGFDDPPAVLMPYNKPYYPDLVEAAGLRPARRLLAYQMDRPGDGGRSWAEVRARLQARQPGLTIRPGRPEAWREELAIIQEIYNAAWRENWAYAPLTPAQSAWLARKLRPLIVPELVLISEYAGRPAGVLLALPDYNQALLKIRGRLGPWSVLRFLWLRRRVDRFRIMLNGVLPERRHLGVAALQILAVYGPALARGYRRVEMSWVDEANLASRRIIERFGGRVAKSYLVYEGEI